MLNVQINVLEIHCGKRHIPSIILNIFISPKLVVQYIHDKARTKLT